MHKERKSTLISLNGWFTIEGENSLQLVSHLNHFFWERKKKKHMVPLSNVGRNVVNKNKCFLYCSTFQSIE